MKTLLFAWVILLALPASATTVVLYQDKAVSVDQVLGDPNDLWVTPADLTRVNQFTLKPEGACLDDLCVPVKQDSDSAIFVTRSGQRWFNVSELARRLNQAYVFDHNAAVWSFTSSSRRQVACMFRVFGHLQTGTVPAMLRARSRHGKLSSKRKH